MMNEDKNIEYNKFASRFKKDSKIKECFHFDSTSCSKKIISAHSVQKSGILSILEDEIEGNLSVFSFLHVKLDEYANCVAFKPIGKKQASTFSGFCGYHDTVIFNEIENNPVDLDNDEHCFLLSYRAFAKEYHAKKETIQGTKVNELYKEKEFDTIRNDSIYGGELGLRDGEIVKKRMNQILKAKSFDELEFFTYELNYMIPIALATSFTPDYSYRNKLLNKSESPDEVYEMVNFVIQPSADGKTQILFSCLPEQKKSILFINELANLTDIQLQKAISSVVISHVENTFFSPTIWRKMKGDEQKQLLFELTITNPLMSSMSNEFFHSKLNLFDRKYRKTPPNNTYT